MEGRELYHAIPYLLFLYWEQVDDRMVWEGGEGTKEPFCGLDSVDKRTLNRVTGILTFRKSDFAVYADQ